MQATLAEVNGNNHGPESLSCRSEGGRSTCRRTEKSPAVGSPSPARAGEGGHLMRGSGASMQGAGPEHEGMHQRMHQGPNMPSQSQSQSQSMLWTKPPHGECHPDSAPCRPGSACKAGSHDVVSGSRPRVSSALQAYSRPRSEPLNPQDFKTRTTETSECLDVWILDPKTLRRLAMAATSVSRPTPKRRAKVFEQL